MQNPRKIRCVAHSLILAHRSLMHRLENLISRFEEPNSAARWDAPLITVPFFDPSLCQKPEAQDATPCGEILGSGDAERIWEALTTGDVKPPNVAVLPVRADALRCCRARLMMLFEIPLRLPGSQFDNIVSDHVGVCDGIRCRDVTRTAGTLAFVWFDNAGSPCSSTSTAYTNPIRAHNQPNCIYANVAAHQATVHEAESACGIRIDQ